MSYTRTVESRAYDTHYDPVYTTSTNIRSDPRVAAAVSTTDAVSGTHRFQYFRRPVMPRVSAIPAQVLLAPTAEDDHLVPVEEEPEPSTKTVEVQTVYRESEAQTIPYTPEYTLAEGADPEILMLQGLTYANGLPAGMKEIEMIEHARLKRDLENNMLPFTDEACFVVRKNLMETQELREYKLREAEVEAQRDLRLATLKRALDEREETTEFLSSQRVEAIRQSRMDAREKTLQKIRKKRINVLRKLARKRNTVDPVLSNSAKRDIINDYFDRGSSVYAPQKRDGARQPDPSARFDTTGRVASLNVADNISELEDSVPQSFLTLKTKSPAHLLGGQSAAQNMMSKTAPIVGPGGGRAAIPRMTSAASRSERNTKRNVETMHIILTKKRQMRTGEGLAVNTAPTEEIAHGSPSDAAGDPATPSSPTKSSLLSRKPKGRPRTPDLTTASRADTDNQPLFSALTLLQKLIRGRAVQNSMFEGRYRRAELISELRSADEYNKMLEEYPEEKARVDEAKWSDVIESVKDTTVDAVAGAVSSGMLHLLTQEKERAEYFVEMQAIADKAIKERKNRELAEAGRRQKEDVPDLKYYTLKKPPPEPEEPEMTEAERIMTPVTSNFANVVISTALEKVAVNEVVTNIEQYPSLIKAFKAAETR